MKHKFFFIIIMLTLLTSYNINAHNLSHEETTKKILENQEHVASLKNLSIYGIESIFIAILCILIIGGLVALVYHQNKDKWNSFWNFIERHLTCAFIIAWLFGFSVYLVGTSIINENASFLEQFGSLFCQAPMACVHAFEMFILESDVSAIHQEFHNSLLYMSCFSLSHFLAITVSLLFIIKYFGYNLFAKFKLIYSVCIKRNFDELYVFWGMNEASYCLAKDIQHIYDRGKKTGNYEIIIMNQAEDDSEETKKEHTSLERLFSFLSFKREELDRYKELGCLTINLFYRLTKIKIAEKEEQMDVLKKEMDLSSLAKLINKTNTKVHIFFFGNDEEENIIGTTMLCKDSTINTYSKKSHKVHIYCHARYDSVNRVIEDKYSNDNIEVKVVDSSHDSINLLKSKQEYHPINFVDIDTEDNFGTVKSQFTSLVVGFGETGRDAVRYLYEYGAFVDNNSSKEDDNPSMTTAEIQQHNITRSSFKCYVVDMNADNLGGHFFANAPALKNIKLWNTDILTPLFYEKLHTICQNLNYVVLALGNDELNITTAVHIYNYIRKHRKDLTKFVIFVRCHNYEQKKHLQHIANHYNEYNCANKNKDHIIIFGTEDQLYTYDQIIENDFEDEGRQYNALYCEASGENGPKNQWQTRHNILLGKKTLDALSELRRKESQDIANAYHALTKIHIMKKFIEDDNKNVRLDFQNLRDCFDNIQSIPKFIRQDGTISPEGFYTEQEKLLFRNLARLEHLRWNAAHEVMGYQNYADGDPNEILVKDKKGRHVCNETFKLHNCLIDWQNLDAEMNDEENEWNPDYKRYDYVVITASLMLNSKR